MTVLLLLCLSAFIAGFGKVSGGGLGILVVPLMAMAYGAKESVGLVLPILIVADIFAVIFYRSTCNWNLLLKIFPITALGVMIGAGIFQYIPTKIFEIGLGILILVLLILEIVLEKLEYRVAGNRYHTYFFGILTGITTMLANAAGPLMSLYFLQMGLSKKEFVGTKAWFFLFLNLFKLPFSIGLGLISGSSITLNFYVIPLIFLGALLGVWVVKKINFKIFQGFIRISTLVAGVNLLF